MNENIVIIGASQSHIPFILAARRLGFKTIVFDQNPSAPGAALADRFYPISTHDVERILAECLNLTKQDIPTGIITYSGYTMPLKAAARVSDAFDLRSFSMQAVDNTTNKAQMKQKLIETHIPTPEWLVARNWNEASVLFLWIVLPLSL